MASPAASLITNRARNTIIPFQNFVDAWQHTAPGGGNPSLISMEDDPTIQNEAGFTGTLPSAAAVTITGTAGATGTATVTILGVPVVTVVTSGDTPTVIAGNIVTSINNNTTLGGVVRASNAAGVLTVAAVNPSPALNGATFTAIFTTVTVSAFGSVTAFGTGGAGPVFPLENFALGDGLGHFITLRAGHAVLLKGAMLVTYQSLIAAGTRRGV